LVGFGGQAIYMKRRNFIAPLDGAAAWPLVACAAGETRFCGVK